MEISQKYLEEKYANKTIKELIEESKKNQEYLTSLKKRVLDKHKDILEANLKNDLRNRFEVILKQMFKLKFVPDKGRTGMRIRGDEYRYVSEKDRDWIEKRKFKSRTFYDTTLVGDIFIFENLGYDSTELYELKQLLDAYESSVDLNWQKLSPATIPSPRIWEFELGWNYSDDLHSLEIAHNSEKEIDLITTRGSYTNTDLGIYDLSGKVRVRRNSFFISENIQPYEKFFEELDNKLSSIKESFQEIYEKYKNKFDESPLAKYEFLASI